MMRLSSIGVGLLLAAVGGCSNDPAAPVGPTTITLSATQAAGLVSRVQSFGSDDPTLEALADTVEAVLNGGAEAHRIEVTTDLGATSFYAVSLHRAINGASPSATFHVIAFDDPSTPTHFIILGGWATGAVAPNSVSGPIGGQATTSLTAHLFTLSGSQLSRWSASTGTMAFTAMELLATCAAPTDVACRRGTMDVAFDITGPVPGNGTSGQRTVSGVISGVPGIRLSF